MTYTALQLITRSWFLSGIVARNLQFVSGDQATEGLQLLNDLLNFKQIETDLVPYYQYITFPCVPSQEFYYLPYVSMIESMTFNLDVVRYPMSATSRTNYFGSARVDNISTLPFSYNYDRGMGGGNLAMYFLPDSTYQIKAKVKLFLVDVELNTDLTNITESFTNPNNIPYFTPYTFLNNSNQGYDTAYIEYLRYSLAEMMCSEYGIMFNPESKAKLISYQRKLMYESPPDLTMMKAGILSSDRTPVLNWGFVNLARGWVPT